MGQTTVFILERPDDRRCVSRRRGAQTAVHTVKSCAQASGAEVIKTCGTASNQVNVGTCINQANEGRWMGHSAAAGTADRSYSACPRDNAIGGEGAFVDQSYAGLANQDVVNWAGGTTVYHLARRISMPLNSAQPDAAQTALELQALRRRHPPPHLSIPSKGGKE